MNSYLHELEIDAVLLMYLADELPAEDRVEVEQLLADDPRLQEQLASLKVAHAAMVGGLDQLDAAAAPPVADVVARRQIGRLIRQWQVDQVARPSEPAAPERARLRWWVYPAAAAAMILVGLLVWWGNSEVPMQAMNVPGGAPAVDPSNPPSTPNDNTPDAPTAAPRDLLPGEELALLERSLESTQDDVADKTVAVLGAKPEDRVDAVGLDLLSGTSGGPDAGKN